MSKSANKNPRDLADGCVHFGLPHPDLTGHLFARMLCAYSDHCDYAPVLVIVTVCIALF